METVLEKNENSVKAKISRTINRTVDFFRGVYYTPKLLIFMLNIGVYAGNTLIADYLHKKCGISKQDYGLIVSFQGLQFLTSPMWTSMADKYQKHKWILLGISLYSVLFYSMHLIHVRNNETSLVSPVYYGICSTLYVICVSGMFPLTDHAVLAILSKRPNFTKQEFGKQRLWGTVAHNLATVIAGESVRAAFRNGWANQFIPMFLLSGLSILTFCALVFFLLPNSLNVEDNGKSIESHKTVVTTENKKSFRKSCIHLMKNWEFNFLLLFILVVGMGRAVPHSAISLILDEKMKLEENEKSWLVSSRIFMEIIMFYYGKSLLRSVGPYWMMLVAQLACSLRNLGYYVIPADYEYRWLVILLESLKGITSGSLVSSAVQLCSDLAPDNMQATAQGLFGGVYAGLAVALGGLVIYGIKGSLDMAFLITASSGFAAFVLFFIKYGFIDDSLGFKCTRKSAKNSKVTELSVNTIKLNIIQTADINNNKE